jgi:hypothetical protein
MSAQGAALRAVAASSSHSGMKHLAMTRPKDPSPPSPVVATRGEDLRPEAAFDLWLQRSLHQLFDNVAKEPIPEELLRLIEGHRKP